MSKPPYYAQGLRFSCTRCSSCCRHESGFVYLSENDLSRLANELEMDYTSFIETWCRWVPFERDTERLSLKEKSSFDCILWSNEGGCMVYNARPLQCRAFPFWESIMCSLEAWKTTGTECPGINTGGLHQREEIEGFLRSLEEELIVERKMLHIGG
jgi:Fe-S-cluster containining protein